MLWKTSYRCVGESLQWAFHECWNPWVLISAHVLKCYIQDITCQSNGRAEALMSKGWKKWMMLVVHLPQLPFNENLCHAWLRALDSLRRRCLFEQDRGCPLKPPIGFRMTQRAGHWRPATVVQAGLQGPHRLCTWSSHLRNNCRNCFSWKLCPHAENYVAIIMFWLL